MDKTLSEVCVRDSIVKFFVDALVTTESLTVLFDEDIDAPGSYPDKYVSIRFGQLGIEERGFSFQIMNIHMITSKDPEGMILSGLRDTVFKYLTDDTEGVKRVPFYNSSVIPWVQIGGFLITGITESPQMDGAAQTKIKSVIIKLQFAAKI